MTHEIQEALRASRRKQEFGLVFEEHIPETTSLHNFSVRSGSIVEVRQGDPPGMFRVIAVSETVATIASIPSGDQTIEMPIKDLLVVKPFGEPIYPVLVMRRRIGFARSAWLAPEPAVRAWP